MASNYKQNNLIQGDGDPSEGDGLCTNLSLFPIGTIYINNTTGKVFSRDADTGFLADWVSQSGEGGSSLFPTTGTGTATGDVIGSLGGNSLNINQGADFMLRLEPSAPGGQVAAMVAKDGAGHTTQIGAYANSDDGYGFSIFSDGPDGTKNVDLYSNSNDGTLLLTANGGIRLRNLDFNAFLEFIGDTKILRYEAEGNALLTVDPTANAEKAVLSPSNSTGGGNGASIGAYTTDLQGIFTINSQFNNEAKYAQINGVSNTSGSSIEYTADKHKFVGVSEFADNAAALSGGLEAGMIYRTGDALKIVH